MEVVYIIIGVSGSGKTTIGKLLANHLQLPFYDADNFHPQQNIEKMSQGLPLNDNDRMPWLQALSNEIKQWENGAVLACSALKSSYRNILSQKNKVQFIYLKGDYDTILSRMEQRDHFMKPEMLQSQFDTLEPPNNAIVISIEQSQEQVLEAIQKQLLSNAKAQLGIVGMGVMGKSLAKNALNRGIAVAAYNRATHGEAQVIPDLMKEIDNEKLQAFSQLEAFIHSLASPRKILLMVPAGAPVDSMINQLLPLLDTGDILMDGGNSHYKDTQQRELILKEKGIDYLGIGVSGGEQGALLGPSMMAGGGAHSYSSVSPLLKPMAAKDSNGGPCIALVGSNGAGHAVKTLHNGIEYAEMQLLAEVYGLLQASYSQEEIATILLEWNQSAAQSFLLETTIDILKKKEGTTYLLPKILDVAKAKGTGSWSVSIALEQGIPANCLTAAVQARSISSQKKIRVALAKKVHRKNTTTAIDLDSLQKAYHMARIINHHQGFEVIKALATTENWEVNLSEVARIWTEGCILKSQLLKNLQSTLKTTDTLLLDKDIIDFLKVTEKNLENTLQVGQTQGTSLPCFSAAYQFWLGITTKDSTANMIQAQRDAFGAHTYQRVDKSEDQTFTTNWKQND